MGLWLACPSGFCLGLRALRWFGVCGPGQGRVRFPAWSVFQQGTGLLHGGCFVWTPTPPLSGRRHHASLPRVCLCACSLWPGRRAGLPGAVWCASPFLCVVRRHVSFFFARPPPGWGCPFLFVCLPAFGFLFVVFFLVSLRPRCFSLSLVSGPGCPGLWRWLPSPPPLPFFLPSSFSSLPACFAVCFLPPSFACAPPLFFPFFLVFLFLLRPGFCCRLLCLGFDSFRPSFPLPPPFSFFWSFFFPSSAPPPPALCVPPCAVWCRRAVLAFRPVFCGAILPFSALRVVPWCPALLGCGLRWLFVCSVVWCRAVGCHCVLYRVSGRVAPLLCSRCGLLSCFCLRCRVLCSAMLCCAALLRVALPGVVLLCAVLCCLAPFGAAALCVVPWGAVSCPGVLCLPALCDVLSPRAVCSVLCLFWRRLLVRAVVRRWPLCFVRPGVSCCAFPVLSALCGAALCCAGAVASCSLSGLCRFWRLVLPCSVVCCAVSCGVVLCCCALCRVILWPAVLCCGLRRGWLAALQCGAGCCGALLSLRAVLPRAVPRGAVLPRGAVVSCPVPLFIF